MRYPKFIKKDSKIYVTAPSLGLAGEYYGTRGKYAVRNLKKLGFDVMCTESTFKQGPSLLKNVDYKKKADEFMLAYKNGDCVIAAAGGEIEIKTISFLDFNKLKKLEPKWFLGFSDNTNISFLLTTLCDVSSIYTYNFGSYGANKPHKSLLDNLELLKGNKLSFNSYDKYSSKDVIHDKAHADKSFTCDESSTWKSLNNKDVAIKGRLIGGCLDCLISLVGTKYDKFNEFKEKYKKDGIILFFESCDLSVISQLRAITQLKNANWINNKLKGIIIGRPIIRDEMFGVKYEQVLHDTLDELNIPVIYDFDVGHLPPVVPMINGAIAKISLKNKKGTIEYKLI